MNRPRWWLVAPALLASAVLNLASAGEIRDKAGLFTPETVKSAQAELDRFEKEYSVPVTIETIESLDGAKIGQEIQRRAEAVGTEGVYVLIPKQEHQILAEASKHYRQYLTRNRMVAVQDAFLTQFKRRDFDAGLTQGVAKLGTVMSDAKSEAGGTIRQNSAPNVRRGGAAAPVRQAPARRNPAGGFSLMWLIVGGLVLFFLFRIIGSLFRGRQASQYGGGPMMGGRGGYPGQGGPGYGGGYGGAPAGGGGFMSSLFGGIGGAMAGNWLYDRMSGHNQGGGYTDQTGYGAGAGGAPLEDAGSEWGGAGNDAGADWGGGGIADNSGGGDWGGGGGDWGGGGGGGDWGGGGGGGGDDGGSW